MTNYPMHDVYYPLIVIEPLGMDDSELGMNTEGRITNVTLRITVFSKDTKSRDVIYDQIYNLLRTTQTGSGTISENLFDFRLINAFNQSEDMGQEKLHRKIIEVSYSFIAV